MSMSIDSMASMLNTTNTDATTNYNANALKKSLNGVSSDTSADELMQVCKDFESYFVEEVIKEVKKNLLPDDEDKTDRLHLIPSDPKTFWKYSFLYEPEEMSGYPRPQSAARNLPYAQPPFSKLLPMFHDKPEVTH